jgi:hypothetical protein
MSSLWMNSVCFFYPISKVRELRVKLLTFEQGDESLGATWERSMQMAYSEVPHGIPEEMLMQHFISGLQPTSAFFMDVTSADLCYTRPWLRFGISLKESCRTLRAREYLTIQVRQSQ